MVRRALRHGRGRLHLLPAAGRVDGAGLGRADAGRLHDARQGVRPHDAASGQGRDDPGGSPRGDAGGRARPRRSPAARAPRRDLPPLPRGARAVARRGEARRHPLPAAAVRRLQGRVARLPRVGARAVRWGRDAGRVPAPLVARRREPRGQPRLPRADRRRLRRRRRAALGHGAEPRPDRGGDDLADRVRPPPRPQSRDLEQARRLGGRALRLPLLRRGARRVDRAAARARRAGPSRPTPSSTTTPRRRIPTTRSAASRRPRPTRSSCAGSST